MRAWAHLSIHFLFSKLYFVSLFIFGWRIFCSFSSSRRHVSGDRRRSNGTERNGTLDAFDTHCRCQSVRVCPAPNMPFVYDHAFWHFDLTTDRSFHSPLQVRQVLSCEQRHNIILFTWNVNAAPFPVGPHMASQSVLAQRAMEYPGVWLRVIMSSNF